MYKPNFTLKIAAHWVVFNSYTYTRLNIVFDSLSISDESILFTLKITAHQVVFNSYNYLHKTGPNYTSC